MLTKGSTLSLPPHTSDPNNLYIEGKVEEGDRDRNLYHLMAMAFSPEELLDFLSRQPVEDLDTQKAEFTAVRRCISALRAKKNYEKTVGIAPSADEELRRWTVKTLSPIAESPKITASMKKDIAQAVLHPILYNDVIPFRIWWLALLSDELVQRAADYILESYKTQQADTVKWLEDLIAATPADHGHHAIWWHFNHIADRLPSALPARVIHALVGKITQAKDRGEMLDDTSVGPICSVIDKMFLLPRGKEGGFDTDGILTLTRSVLEFYLETKPNANTWMERTEMMNLIERSVSIYQHVFDDEDIRNLIRSVRQQPEEAYAPQAHTRRETRLPEREAAQRIFEAMEDRRS